MSDPPSALRQPAPHGIIENFLGSEAVERLLAYCNDNHGAFADTSVGNGQQALVDQERRISLGLYELGDFKTMMARRLAAALPSMVRQLGVASFGAVGSEIELVAHGDGAFFGRHIDTVTGVAQPRDVQRMISAIYYFHRVPKGFAGGQLRLYALLDAGDDAPHVDIEPACDSLVFFPSWAPHEVRPIQVPSRQFADSRFAVNCWICRRTPQSA